MITKTSELPWVLGSRERCLTEVFAGEWTEYEYIGAKTKNRAQRETSGGWVLSGLYGNQR